MMMAALAPAEKRFKAHPLGPEVHRILWEEWDPIGVRGMAPDDEYDSYVWPVVSKIAQGASVEEIADYLDWAVGTNMGMQSSREMHLPTARKLLALRSGAASNE